VARSKRTRQSNIGVRAEINVTSLVDVAFTLLVVFIITAPILQGGVEVNVPRADVAPLAPDSEPIIVSITADDRTYIGDAEVPSGDLASMLTRVLEARGITTVYVNGDSASNYGAVMEAISVVNSMEGVSLGLIAEQRPRPR